jgi:hypothetical protein
MGAHCEKLLIQHKTPHRLVEIIRFTQNIGIVLSYKFHRRKGIKYNIRK